MQIVANNATIAADGTAHCGLPADGVQQMRWLPTVGCDGGRDHAQSIGGEASDAIGTSAYLMMVITVQTAAMMMLRLR